MVRLTGARPAPAKKTAGTELLSESQRAVLHLSTALFGSNDAAEMAERLIEHVKIERLQESAQQRLSPVELASAGLIRLFENEGAFA